MSENIRASSMKTQFSLMQLFVVMTGICVVLSFLKTLQVSLLVFGLWCMVGYYACWPLIAFVISRYCYENSGKWKWYKRIDVDGQISDLAGWLLVFYALVSCPSIMMPLVGVLMWYNESIG